MYRRFGRTNADISVLTCGTMRLQYQWQDMKLSDVPRDCQKNVENIIELAIDKGINHIETARGYGSSEVQLGGVFKNLDRKTRSKLYIQTKVIAAPLADVEQKLETSWDNLQLDYIDFLSIHCLNNERTSDNELDTESMLAPNGILAKARQWQKEGRVRHIGFSTHAGPNIVIPLLKTGWFSYVNLLWSYIYQYNTPSIVEAKKQDMGVFIISPIARSGLLNRPPRIWQELCKPYTAMQFNVLFSLLCENVDTLSIGPAVPSELEYHVNTLSLWDKAKDIVNTIHEALYSEICSRLGKEWVDHWQEGLPSVATTPKRINIHEILRLWTLCKGWDFEEFTKERYSFLTNSQHFFPGNALTSEEEADLIQTLKGSRFADTIPTILKEAHSMLFDANLNSGPLSLKSEKD